MQIAGDGGPLTPSAAKHRRLLAALALSSGRSCTADELVDALWAGSPPASATKLLQVYVSQVRRLLPPGLTLATHAAGYALDLGSGTLDATRFERLLDDAADAARDGNPYLALSLADQALALWRGPAYADVAYDDFARGEAERLEELRLDAVEERLQALLDLGRHGEALGELLGLAAEHPLRARLQALAMLALYRAGRQTDALDLYERLRRRLSDELALEPGAELRDLQRKILNHDPSLEGGKPSGAAIRALPEPPNTLVGRERELEQLVALLQSRGARLLVLTGAGGSGKTRLALEAARRAAGSYANGAALVELAPLREPELVVPAIAGVLDVAESAETPPLDTLAAALRQRELLIVLDNAEHLREAAPALVELVTRAPRLTIVVTSRAVLHVPGEHVFPVAPLGEQEAVELFEQRASSLERGFALSERNGADVLEICRRVDGLPLAVELAAARIRALTPAAIRERLTSRLTLLTGGLRDLPARQQTLRETLDWSAGLLDDEQRRVLARLSVFPSGAALDAAETVCGADLDTLETLVDHNLVRRTEAAGEPRFGLLETIREYADELLGDERRETRRALLVYLCELVDRAELKGTAQAEWTARLDAELENIRAALADADDPELEMRLAGGLWRFWWIRGHLSEGTRRIDAALERGPDVPSTSRARALQGGAGLAWSRGDFDRAVVLATEAVAVAHAVGASYDEQSAHTVLGVVANNRRDFETARWHFEQSTELAVEMGIEPLAEKMNLGVVMLDSGDPAGAVPLFEELLELHRSRGFVEGAGFALLNLGLCAHYLGDPATAREHFQEAHVAFEQLGFRAHVAHAVQGLAAAAAGLGEHQEAARLLGHANAELEEVGWSTDDFDAELGPYVERAARGALGETAFETAYAEGMASEPA